MGDLYNTIMELCYQRGITGYRLCKDIGIQPSIMTDLKSGRKKGLSAKIANEVASYFDVSVGYLLGTEEKEKPTINEDSGLTQEKQYLLKQIESMSDDDIAALQVIVDQVIRRRHE